MSVTPVSYVVEAEQEGARVLDALQAQFTTRREARRTFGETYYDTFDWRLYRGGETFSAQSNDTDWLVSLRSREGTLIHRERSETLPAFAHELPPGTFRDKVAGSIENRRLLPLVRVETDLLGLRVLDEDDKTIARVELACCSAGPPDSDRPSRVLPPELRLLPLRGYDEAHRQVTGFVEQQLKLTRREASLFTSALDAIGVEVATYSSKLRLRLAPDSRSDEAVRAILLHLLDAMQTNEAGTIGDLDSEFLHDFRVAVRRTRSCLGQLKGVLPERSAKPFRDEFKWLGGVTGPTRDLDVWLINFPGHEASLPRGTRQRLKPLREYLVSHQRDEQRFVGRALRSSRYRKLCDEWRAFLEDAQPSPTDEAPRPILELAGERIERMHERVLQRGEAIGPKTAGARLHRLRIDCKKLRYLLEFFHSLYDPSELDPLVRSLKRLQNNLGDFNDLQNQHTSLERFAGEMVEENLAPAETLLAMGRLTERLVRREKRERKRFGKLFAAFASESVPHVRRMLARQPDRAS